VHDRDHSIPSVPSLPPSTPPYVPVPAPPAGWKDTSGFRETFLILLEPDQAATFRRLGDFLHDAACERGTPASTDAPAASTLRTTLAAVLADLRHLEGILVHVARERTASELTPPDLPLASLGAGVALMVRMTADHLAAELGTSPVLPALPVIEAPEAE
jgi:hypothetical protein